MAATEAAVRITALAIMIPMPPGMTDHAITTAEAATATHIPIQVQAAALRAMCWCRAVAARAVHLIHAQVQAATVHALQRLLYALQSIRAQAVRAHAAIPIIQVQVHALRAMYWYRADAVRAALRIHVRELAAIRPAQRQRHTAV